LCKVGALLSDAHLSGADLSDAILNGVEFLAANIEGAIGLPDSVFDGSDLDLEE